MNRPIYAFDQQHSQFAGVNNVITKPYSKFAPLLLVQQAMDRPEAIMLQILPSMLLGNSVKSILLYLYSSHYTQLIPQLN